MSASRHVPVHLFPLLLPSPSLFFILLFPDFWFYCRVCLSDVGVGLRNKVDFVPFIIQFTVC